MCGSTYRHTAWKSLRVLLQLSNSVHMRAACSTQHTESMYECSRSKASSVRMRVHTCIVGVSTMCVCVCVRARTCAYEHGCVRMNAEVYVHACVRVCMCRGTYRHTAWKSVRVLLQLSSSVRMHACVCANTTLHAQEAFQTRTPPVLLSAVRPSTHQQAVQRPTPWHKSEMNT